MANQYLYSLTDTWNAGATTFAAIKMNVTDSASAADSKLLQLQIGGADKFAVGKDGSVTLTDSDAGASSGPTLALYRDSGTPAASDVLGRLLFQGEDDAGNTEDYAEIYTSIGDPGSGSEDGALVFRANVAGTMTALATLDAAGLTLGTNVPIVFGGTGAASTLTNLGVSAFGQTLIDDASASVGRATLVSAATVQDKSSGYTAVAADRNTVIRCTATLTLALTAAATLGSDWFIFVKADGGTVTIDPDSSETIDGAATITVNDGSGVIVFCTGTAFQSLSTGSFDGTFTNAFGETVTMAFASGSENADFEITYSGGDAVKIADDGTMTVKDLVITG